MNKPSGQLWVIATPIGNLSDLSPRAKEALENVQLLACESKKSAMRLYSAFKLSLPKFILYREDKAEAGERQLISALGEGLSCGLISDAGTPAISDPGWRIVEACYRHGFPVLSLAGPSSLSAALSVAGLPTRRFLFEGFPPHNNSERKQFFQKVASNEVTTVFFETPHHILDTLKILMGLCPPTRRLTICRELTKLHETSLQKSLAEWSLAPPLEKGEFVLILEGAEPQDSANAESKKLQEAILQAKFLQESGLATTPLRQFLQQFAGIGRNDAYRIALDPDNA